MLKLKKGAPKRCNHDTYEKIEKESHLPVKRDREYYENLINELSMKLEKEGV